MYVFWKREGYRTGYIAITHAGEKRHSKNPKSWIFHFWKLSWFYWSNSITVKKSCSRFTTTRKQLLKRTFYAPTESRNIKNQKIIIRRKVTLLNFLNKQTEKSMIQPYFMIFHTSKDVENLGISGILIDKQTYIPTFSNLSLLSRI